MSSPQSSSIVGRCSNCTLDLNTGEYGYFMSVENCICPSGNP